jgi:electron transfer flavoprotein alpha subunit
MIMERILGLIHAGPSGEVARASRDVVAGAARLAAEVHAGFAAGVIGGAAARAGASLSLPEGATVFAVTDPQADIPAYAVDVRAIEALVRAAEATVVIVPSTPRFSRALPGAAHRLGGRVDTRVTGIGVQDESLRIERWYYRQRMVGTSSRFHRPWLLAVETGTFEPAPEGLAGDAAVREVPLPVPQGGWRTRVVGEEAVSGGAHTIRPEAELLFVAGAGWTKKQADGRTHVKEAEALIRNFLEISRASLGSSKSLVDQSLEGEDVISFMTHLNQVGQTGTSPRHRKGLSACCHGEEPHAIGWRFIQERRAINLDPDCGWARGKADVLYVADAFAVLAKLNELLAG